MKVYLNYIIFSIIVFLLFQVRTRENPTKWPIYDPKAQSTELLYEVPPPPLPRKYRDNNVDNLNPDVPEFVPGNELAGKSCYIKVIYTKY